MPFDAALDALNTQHDFREVALSPDHSQVAWIETAPAKNRVTAGVAAVDLYENKLDRFDKALEILLVLHRAKLSSLPVRERLARANKVARALIGLGQVVFVLLVGGVDLVSS